MQKQLSTSILMVCGIIALVFGFMTMPSASVVSAQSSAPSPRPAIQPTSSMNEEEIQPTAIVRGRLTGTVIDLRTGAPAPNIAIIVGSQTIYTDANGNYDIWLISGYYRLDMALTSVQGTPIQPAQAIAVGAGDTVVVHLFFTSPTPTTVAGQIAPRITATPTVAPPISNLPDTSVARDSNTSAVANDKLAVPQELPNTAAAAGIGSPGTWILFGALLLGLSLVIQLAPRPRPRARLGRTRRAKRRTNSDENLLSDLLDKDL